MLWFVLIGEYDMLFCLFLLCIDSINARLVQDDMHARLHTLGREEKRARKMNGVPFFFSFLSSIGIDKKRRRQRRKISNQTFLIFYEMWRMSVFGWCWTDRDDTDVLYLMYIFITLTNAISSIHLLLALINILVGIISQSQLPIWMAHSVSPIWSGVFVSWTNVTIPSHIFSSFQFGLCGALGIVCARQKGLYVVNILYWNLSSINRSWYLDIMLRSIEYRHIDCWLCEHSTVTLRISEYNDRWTSIFKRTKRYSRSDCIGSFFDWMFHLFIEFIAWNSIILRCRKQEISKERRCIFRSGTFWKRNRCCVQSTVFETIGFNSFRWSTIHITIFLFSSTTSWFSLSPPCQRFSFSTNYFSTNIS